MSEIMDFPMILVCLVFLGTIIWILDLIFWASKRKALVEGVREKFPGWDDPGGAQNQKYNEEVERVAKEPWAIEYARSFTPVLLIVLVLRSFLVEPFQIPSSSMVPSLEVGDFILVNKFVYGIRLPVLRSKVIEMNKPERGDVMVFFPPNDPRYFIKRVIGLPGDHVQYDNGAKVLYINGKEISQELQEQSEDAGYEYQVLSESLAQEPHQIRKHLLRSRITPQGDIAPLIQKGITVPEGHYFMMGDNRDNSSDSRVWGYVPEENIVGKAFAIWMHWEEFLSLPSFSRMGIIK